MLLARRGNDYPLTYPTPHRRSVAFAKLAAAGVAASVRGSLVVVTGAMQPQTEHRAPCATSCPPWRGTSGDPGRSLGGVITGKQAAPTSRFYRAAPRTAPGPRTIRPKTTDKAQRAPPLCRRSRISPPSAKPQGRAARARESDRYSAATGRYSMDVLPDPKGDNRQTNTDYFEVTRGQEERLNMPTRRADRTDRMGDAKHIRARARPVRQNTRPMRRQVDTRPSSILPHVRPAPHGARGHRGR